VPDRSLDDSNAQHMQAMGLDPDLLGAAYEAEKPRAREDRCPSIGPDGLQCARVKHTGVHARGQVHWDDEVDLPEGFRISIPKISTNDRAQAHGRVDLIDYVAAAMRTADGDHTMGTGALAEVAVDAVLRWADSRG